MAKKKKKKEKKIRGHKKRVMGWKEWQERQEGVFVTSRQMLCWSVSTDTNSKVGMIALR